MRLSTVYSVVLAMAIPSLCASNDSCRIRGSDLVTMAISAGECLFKDPEKPGCKIAEILKGVTSIRKVKNLTSERLRLWKVDKKPFEPSTQEYVIEPGDSVNIAMWAPWANSAADFEDHHMDVFLGSRKVAAIWQKGDFVRFSPTGEYFENAPPVVGIGASGGDRSLVVSRMSNRDAFIFGGLQCW